MPNPVLMSSSLYGIRDFPRHLEAVAVAPGPRGYKTLRDKYSVHGQTTLSPRWVEEMMFRGQLVKWVSCENIVRLINRARDDAGLAELALSEAIEEHEYWLKGLKPCLEQIAKQTGYSAASLRMQLAQDTGKHSGLIRSLERGFRTTEDRCQTVSDAISARYGWRLEPTREAPRAVRVAKMKPVRGKKTNRPVQAVLPMFR